MPKCFSLAAWGWIVCAGLSVCCGQDRDTKVRNDREAFQEDSAWVYDDLDDGLIVARETGKPLLVVFRCIP